MTCQWFLLCANPATTTVPHPIPAIDDDELDDFIESCGSVETGY